MDVIVKTNGTGYEKHSFLGHLIGIPLKLSLNLLPSGISNKLFTLWSEDARLGSRWARTYKALEVMYTFPERRKRKEVSWGDIFWESFLSNARAVRNRLVLTKKMLKSLIVERSKEVNPVHVLSIGSGSGRSIIETVAEIDDRISVKVTFLDRSRLAIKKSKELSARILKNENRFRWICTKVGKISDCLTKTNSLPDVVEMVGFLDYFSDSEAVDLFRLIYQVLTHNGWLIVSNIAPNMERPFVTKGIKWSLVYREPEKLKKLLMKSGFRHIELIQEPLMIYTFAIARKA